MMVLVMGFVTVLVIAGLIGYVAKWSKRLSGRYQTLWENAGDAVVILDIEGKIVYASSSVNKVIGYSVAEAMKLEIGKIAYPEDLNSLDKVMRQVMANPGVPITGHRGRMLHGDGTWHWYEAVITNLLADKNVKGIVDNFRDVTDAHLAEERSLTANRLYNFISQINQAIVQTHTEDALFEKACQIASDVGKFPIAWVGLLDSDHSTISIAQGCGIPKEFLTRFTNAVIWERGPISMVLATQKSFICNDIACLEHDEWRDFADLNSIRSFMVLPIKKDNQIFGMLNIYAGQTGFFSEQERSLLEEVATDISFAIESLQRERARIRVEKQHRHSEIRLKQAQTIAHVGSFDIDFSTGVATWSEELCRLYGFDVSENVHPYDAWLEMVHPLDIQRVKEVSEAARASLSSSAVYHRIIRRDGSIRHFFSQAEFDFDSDGRPIGMHGVVHDITQIKESEGARSQSEQNLQLIMDLIPQGIFIKDAQGHYLFVNKSFASLYGVSAELFLSDPSYLLRDNPQERALYMAQDQQVIRSGEKLVIPELPYTFADGTISYYYTVKVPFVRSDGSGRGMLGIALDVTDRKNAELERSRLITDLTQRNKDLEQFSYVISHNVRAPLANIISLISLLEADDLIGDQNEVIDSLRISTHKLEGIIQDLNFILNTNNASAEAMEMVVFSDTIADIRISIANLLSSSRLVIITDFEQVKEIYCIKSYLHSIFYNLILNSINYRRSGTDPYLKIASRIENNLITLDFTDNGMGIDMDRFGKQLFGLYKRFHPGTKGKGMGLYMVKTQVEQLRGAISVNSAVGEGTTFTLTFDC